MKFLKLYLLITSVLLVAFSAEAQKSPKSMQGDYSKFSVSAGAGISNYYGDLIKKSSFFAQPSYAFSAGAQYAITPNLAARLDLGFQKLQGSDSKPGGAHPERNLRFESDVFDFAIAAEYTILNLDKFPISPYISAGVGVVLFNPYAEDVLGNRQNLVQLGTEGQGIPGYAEKYSTSALEFPLGAGVKYRINKEVMLSLDFNYRITKTDYLDDVSSSRYPDKALLDGRNPKTANYTWQGAGAYPNTSTVTRGNPNNNDGFFTTQLKLIFKLKN